MRRRAEPQPEQAAGAPDFNSSSISAVGSRRSPANRNPSSKATSIAAPFVSTVRAARRISEPKCALRGFAAGQVRHLARDRLVEQREIRLGRRRLHFLFVAVEGAAIGIRGPLEAEDVGAVLDRRTRRRVAERIKSPSSVSK